MKKHLNSKTETGEKLISFAWILEYFFVAIGLIVALSITLSAIMTDEGSIELNTAEIVMLVPGLIVWFAVAFTELLKIPLTKGMIYAKNIFVKLGAACFLAAICFITFESMMMGLDNSMSMRQQQIDTKFSQIDDLNNKISIVDEKISFKPNANENEISKELYASIEPQIASIDEQISALNIQISNLRNPSNSSEVDELKRQTNYLVGENDKFTGLIASTNSSYDKKISQNKANEISELTSVLFGKKEIKEKYEELRKSLIAERDQILSTYVESIDKNNRKITTLNNKIAKLTSINTQDQRLISDYTSKINLLSNQKSELYQNTNSEIAKRMAKADISQLELEQLQDQKMQLQSEKSEIVADLNNSNSDIVLTVAKLLDGVDQYSDIKPNTINEASLIIIVSLSLIVALSGPVLTLVAMNNFLEEREPKRNRTLLAIRKFFVDLRKKIRKPKVITEIVEKEVEKVIEVTKEVPVEKVVKEVVEVVKPVEITRYVGIPVPKNPEELPTYNEATEVPKINHQEVIGGVQ